MLLYTNLANYIKIFHFDMLISVSEHLYQYYQGQSLINL